MVSMGCHCTSIFSGTVAAYIIEILNLDELAQDQAYEFLFVLGPFLLRPYGGANILAWPQNASGAMISLTSCPMKPCSGPKSPNVLACKLAMLFMKGRRWPSIP